MQGITSLSADSRFVPGFDSMACASSQRGRFRLVVGAGPAVVFQSLVKPKPDWPARIAENVEFV